MPKRTQVIVSHSNGDLGVKYSNPKKIFDQSGRIDSSIVALPNSDTPVSYLQTPFGTKVWGTRKALENLQKIAGGEIIYIPALRKSSRLVEKVRKSQEKRRDKE